MTTPNNVISTYDSTTTTTIVTIVTPTSPSGSVTTVPNQVVNAATRPTTPMDMRQLGPMVATMAVGLLFGLLLI